MTDRPEHAELGPDAEANGPAERDQRAAELLSDLPTPEQLDELVRMFQPLVRHLASRFLHRGEALEDLVQVANLALLKAARRFDVNAGARFSTYAIPTILGEIKRHFRDAGWSMRVPRQLQERAMSVRAAIAALTQELGRSPSVPEIAQRCRLEGESVMEALEVIGAYRADSLEEDDGADEGSESNAPAFEDLRFDVIDGWVHVAPLLRRLERREQQLLYMRFVEELTQRQIAARLGISQMHVSRLLRRTLTTLRSWAGSVEQDAPAAYDR